MEPIDIDIIREIARNNFQTQTIVRNKYLPYDMQFALETVTYLGQCKNKKFVIDEHNEFAYTNMIRWIHGDPEFECIDPDTNEIIKGDLNAGIYVAGGTGTGKSWLLDIASAYTLIDKVKVSVGGGATILHWNNYRADKFCDAFVKEGNIEKYKTLRVLGIQDLGSEPLDSVYMGNHINIIMQLIESRGDRQDMITHVSSNFPINHPVITQRYGDRAASRLREMCNYLVIDGPDRRKANKR